jgi:hypothetical protein
MTALNPFRHSPAHDAPASGCDQPATSLFTAYAQDPKRLASDIAPLFGHGVRLKRGDSVVSAGVLELHGLLGPCVHETNEGDPLTGEWVQLSEGKYLVHTPDFCAQARSWA